jgi:ABC-type branched-subunit amino acid transport system permease subunit
VFRSAPRASGYFRTDYAQDLALIQTRAERGSLAVFAAALAVFPFIASPFALDLASQVFLVSIGALSLMLLTGYAGQISLGHAGLIAAGAFTTGILPVRSARHFGSRCPPPPSLVPCSVSSSACLRCGCAGSIWP